MTLGCATTIQFPSNDEATADGVEKKVAEAAARAMAEIRLPIMGVLLSKANRYNIAPTTIIDVVIPPVPTENFIGRVSYTVWQRVSSTVWGKRISYTV